MSFLLAICVFSGAPGAQCEDFLRDDLLGAIGVDTERLNGNLDVDPSLRPPTLRQVVGSIVDPRAVDSGRRTRVHTRLAQAFSSLAADASAAQIAEAAMGAIEPGALRGYLRCASSHARARGVRASIDANGDDVVLEVEFRSRRSSGGGIDGQPAIAQPERVESIRLISRARLVNVRLEGLETPDGADLPEDVALTDSVVAIDLKRASSRGGGAVVSAEVLGGLARVELVHVWVPLGPWSRRVVIASIGDSYASGEGNPGYPPTMWEHPQGIDPEGSKQFHRSRINARSYAVRAIEALPGVEVEYLNVAMSGATVDVGLLGAFGGPGGGEPYAGPALAQIDLVEEWLEDEGHEQLDVLLVSVGGNDIGFGNVVATALLPLGDAVGGASMQVAVGATVAEGSGRAIGLDDLADAYARLEEAIDSRLRPQRVIITDYPDPLRNETGSYCERGHSNFVVGPDLQYYPAWWPIKVGASMANIDEVKCAWIADNLIQPVNSQIRQAADEHGWTLVRMRDVFQEHGFCAGSQRWLNDLNDSWLKQGDLFGVAHPNAHGHEAMGWLISKALVEELGLPVAPQPRVRFNGLVNVPDGAVYSRDERGLWGIEKRFVLELTPTAHEIRSVRLFYSKNQPASGALENEPVVVSVDRWSTLSVRDMYRVDLGEDAFGVCDWTHWRWEVEYGLPGQASAVLRTPIESQLMRRAWYPPISEDGEPVLVPICDEIPD